MFTGLLRDRSWFTQPGWKELKIKPMFKGRIQMSRFVLWKVLNFFENYTENVIWWRLFYGFFKYAYQKTLVLLNLSSSNNMDSQLQQLASWTLYSFKRLHGIKGDNQTGFLVAFDTSIQPQNY